MTLENFFVNDRTVPIGSNHQAECPALLSPIEMLKDRESSHLCELRWSPNNQLSTADVDNWTAKAFEANGMNEEQALALLCYTGFDLDHASDLLLKYRPVDLAWSDDDTITFENWFRVYGKNFTKIQQQLPHKSIHEVMRHYYSTKHQNKLSLITKLVSEYDDVEWYKPRRNIPQSADQAAKFSDATDLIPSEEELQQIAAVADKINKCGPLNHFKHEISLNLDLQQSQLQDVKAETSRVLSSLSRSSRLSAGNGGSDRRNWWSPRLEQLALKAVQQLFISDKNTLATFLNTSPQQADLFLKRAGMQYKLSQLLDRSKLDQFAQGHVNMRSMTFLVDSDDDEDDAEDSHFPEDDDDEIMEIEPPPHKKAKQPIAV